MTTKPVKQKRQRKSRRKTYTMQELISSKRCRRCHRTLTGEKSIEVGYGRVCLQKVLNGRVRDDGDPCTILDRKQAEITRAKVLSYVDHLQGEQGKCHCGAPLTDGELGSYDHEGGFFAPGFEKKQWFYIHCLNCNYDYSLTKLGLTDEVLK